MGDIGEFHVGTIGYDLPDDFNYDICILYNSLSMPFKLKKSKLEWVSFVNASLNESLCDDYILFLDKLYTLVLDRIGGIGNVIEAEVTMQIFTPQIIHLTTVAMVNLIHFKKIPDDELNGFVFYRSCTEEQQSKDPHFVLDTDTEPLFDYLRCFYCQQSKHVSEMKRCAACLNVCYCDQKCQKSHWKIHKKKCK
jgi:hypothetical protein